MQKQTAFMDRMHFYILKIITTRCYDTLRTDKKIFHAYVMRGSCLVRGATCNRGWRFCNGMHGTLYFRMHVNVIYILEYMYINGRIHERTTLCKNYNTFRY